MLIHATMPASRANGPGVRAVLWVQECTLACPGCWNPDTHTTAAGYEQTPELAARNLIRDAALNGAEVEGVTISGGEPMQQADALYGFLCMIRAEAPHWSCGMFSGYSPGELMLGDYYGGPGMLFDRAMGWHHLIRPLLDWAILGRYDRARATGDPLISSGNQDLYLYTDRYQRSDFAGAPAYEATVSPAGDLVQVTGFPSPVAKFATPKEPHS